MQGASRYFLGRWWHSDQGLRKKLLASAHGEGREAAIAALDSLRRIYHLRLPLVEARLGMNGSGQQQGAA